MVKLSSILPSSSSLHPLDAFFIVRSEVDSNHSLRLDFESKRPGERGFSVLCPLPARTGFFHFTPTQSGFDEIATFFSYLIRILSIYCPSFSLVFSFLSPQPISIGWTYERIISNLPIAVRIPWTRSASTGSSIFLLEAWSWLSFIHFILSSVVESNHSKDLESFYQPVRTNISLLYSVFSLSASTIWISSPMR